MRSRRYTSEFTALRLVGGILPAEFLQEVAALRANHQSHSDYGISKSLSLKDEIARYWRIANDLYDEYSRQRAREDIDVEKTGVAQWLVPLLQEVLGFRDVVRTKAVSIGERRFGISHEAYQGAVPMLLTTYFRDLDKPEARFGEDGKRRSPHNLMQEYLNASSRCLWGIVSNGAKLRIVRNNPSLTRPAFIEADLDLIFREQLYSDFSTLWLMAHSSRFSARDAKSSACILENWRRQALEIGERALEHLREGVTEALRHLGAGFLEHEQNLGLRECIASGNLSAQAFFQELLQLVYRLLFLFTAEERNLLHPPEATDQQKSLYRQGYAIARLRERAGLRRNYDRHSDLWQGMKIVFAGLARGAEPLGLCALGGLFSDDYCSHLAESQISNERLLQAVRALSFFRANNVLVRINYRDMGTEELGSVYESLLELHPLLDVESRPWTFSFAGDSNTRGSQRKLTGSYYTPQSLVSELIKSALEPVMMNAVRRRPQNPKAALLELKILDPACGSGHFLLSAARRMAAEIARLENGTETPDEITRQQALREVVQHCIYGVDKNPMAVELCQAALWIETVAPGKPLTFLDSHIRCGDSLVGVMSPEMLDEGIPDEAYTALTGDDKSVCNDLKKQNRQSKDSKQFTLFDRESGPLEAEAQVHEMPEDTLEQVLKKREAWFRLSTTESIRRARLQANLYVAAFFVRKTKSTRHTVPMSQDLSRVRSKIALRPGVEEAVTALATKHRFFHWHLEFPEVIGKGGFDVVLGNPPWERIKLQEQEFFAGRSQEIALAPNKAARDRLIQSLSASNATPAERTLLAEFLDAKRESEAASQFVRKSGRFPLTGVGDVNTYAVFAELFASLISEKGRAGLIVPTGIATDDSTKAFFQEISTHGRLASLYDFENREGVFPGVHRSYKFCLLTLGHNMPATDFVFFATNTQHIWEQDRRFRLSSHEIRMINPNTMTCPLFRSQADAELTKKIYSNVPVLIDESKGDEGNPWGLRFMRMFDMSNDSGLFRTRQQLIDAGAHLVGTTWVEPGGKRWVPLFEAKMIHQYDHRWATYEDDGQKSRNVTETEKASPDFEPQPRYWVSEEEVERRLSDRGWTRQWLMGWRDITNATNERTVIATVFPRVGVNHKTPIVMSSHSVRLQAALLASWSSMPLDYIARQKLGGTSLRISTSSSFQCFTLLHTLNMICRSLHRGLSNLHSPVSQCGPSQRT